MEKDKFECYSWAKGQTGFDPMQMPTASSPPPPKGGKSVAGGVVGGVLGGVGGVVIGGIAGDSKGAKKGSAIGGLSGGVIGGARSSGQTVRPNSSASSGSSGTAGQPVHTAAQLLQPCYSACLKAEDTL